MMPENMSYEEQAQTINISEEKAREMVALVDALDKLADTPEWVEIIEKQYMEKEPARLCLMRGDPNMQSPEDQAALLKSLDAIAEFRQWVIGLRFQGSLALKTLEACKEERDILDNDPDYPEQG